MQDGACLYIRPFIFATEDRLSVSPANRYTFCVVMSPSGAYYGESLNAIRLLISKDSTVQYPVVPVPPRRRQLCRFTACR